MNNEKNKKKIDIEARLFMYILHLKEEKNKKYSIEECEKNIVYLFDNYDEYESYFKVNGFSNISEDLLETCRMKTTREGTIIALKGLCDYAIKKRNLSHIDHSTEKQQFEVLAVPCSGAFVVAPEKIDEFKKSKPNPEVRQQTEEMAEKFRVNNLVAKGRVLKKIMKPNNK